MALLAPVSNRGVAEHEPIRNVGSRATGRGSLLWTRCQPRKSRGVRQPLTSKSSLVLPAARASFSHLGVGPNPDQEFPAPSL